MLVDAEMREFLDEFHIKLEVKKLSEGVYASRSFNFDRFVTNNICDRPQLISGNKDRPFFGCYGVCDSYEQILKKCPMIKGDNDRYFVIAVTPILKCEQSQSGENILALKM